MENENLADRHQESHATIPVGSLNRRSCWREWLRAFVNPYDSERKSRLAARFAALPGAIKTTGQVLGRFNNGCGATFGVMERCNFGCTACYLGERANRQAPLPFEEVAAQLDALACNLGPGGNVQITAGEVTLLPADALARIIAYAYSKGLSPMVMTHGDVIRQDPSYLDRLVIRGGLRKLGIHIDNTQRGRMGFAGKRNERELNAVRDQFAEILRSVRTRLGVRIKAATTMTVNKNNLNQLQPVMNWLLANLDTFRMISFQPQAQTGRTKDPSGVDAQQTWEAIESALGLKLNPYATQLGHPDCTRLAFLLAIQPRKKRFSIRRADALRSSNVSCKSSVHDRMQLHEFVRLGNTKDKELVESIIKAFSGVNLNNIRQSVSAIKMLSVLLRKPALALQLFLYGVTRFFEERQQWITVLKQVLLLQASLKPFVIVVHAFMDERQLQTPEGKERLQACAFKLPLNGKMVSMCEMNGSSLRSETYKV